MRCGGRLSLPHPRNDAWCKTQGEDSMLMVNVINLIAAMAQLLSALANLAAIFPRYVELRRWRRSTLRNLHRRRRC
jgi:hypothetical protein